jgi:hypothetical protein
LILTIENKINEFYRDYRFRGGGKSTGKDPPIADCGLKSKNEKRQRLSPKERQPRKGFTAKKAD